jgi:hypothetical protein
VARVRLSNPRAVLEADLFRTEASQLQLLRARNSDSKAHTPVSANLKP